MSGIDPIHTVWAVLLAFAALTLLRQIYLLHRRSRPASTMPRPRFWLGVGAWTALGLLAQAPDFALAPGWLWRWVVPIGGLLATAAVRWVRAVMPSLMVAAEMRTDSLPAPGNGNGENGRRDERELDAEERQLLRRMRLLLSRRTSDLMVPLADVPAVRAEDGCPEVLDALTRSGARRIPVLDESHARSLGAIDGLELMARMRPASDQGRSGPAEDGRVGLTSDGPPGDAPCTQLRRPIPAVQAWKPAREGLEVLRTGQAGLAAVVDGRDRVVGYLAWQPLFRALLGRASRGGEL